MMLFSYNQKFQFNHHLHYTKLTTKKKNVEFILNLKKKLAKNYKLCANNILKMEKKEKRVRKNCTRRILYSYFSVRSL